MTPERTCCGCRRRAPQPELVRLVVVDGRVVVDRQRRMPGRGAYLHPDAGCVEQATRRRSVPRALRLAATAEADLSDVLGVQVVAGTLDAGPPPCAISTDRA